MRALVALLLLASAAHAAEDGCLKITDYGAVCDNVHNDTAAWHAVVDAASAQGGRCIAFPAGTCWITDGRYWNGSGQQMIVKGTGSASRVRFQNAGGAWLVAGNYAEMRVEDLQFIGTPNQTIDALILILAQSGESAILQNVRVIGVSVGGGSVFKSAADRTEVIASRFIGCAGPSAAAIRADSSLLVDRSRFSDTGSLDGVETSKGTLPYWIALSSTTAHDYPSGTGTIEIRRSRFDEGAWKGIYLAPLPNGLRYQRVVLSGLTFYAPVTTGSRSISISTAENVEIERVQIHPRSSEMSVELLGAGDVIMRQSRISPLVSGAGGVYIDTATRSAKSIKTNAPAWDCHANTCTVE